MRLGLSDSMRSVSLEDTEPLHTATHRRTPRRPRVAETSHSDEATEHNPKPKSFYKTYKTSLCSILGVMLLVMTSAVFRVSLSAWNPSNSQVDDQFEQLERSFSRLGRATARLETKANGFLKSCQNVQIAAKTRAEMLVSSAKKSLAEQARAEMEEQEQVMQEVREYYARQEQQIQETKLRLLAMNITLPVQVTVRPVPESWQNEDQKVLGQLESNDQFADAVMGLSFFAERILEQSVDKGTYSRLSVETISIQTGSDGRQTTRPGLYRVYGSLLFYMVVACGSIVYLWSSITDTRTKKLLHDKWSWSPVPRVLRRLKAFLGTIVVIENLRESCGGASNVDGTGVPLERIEC